MEQPLLEEEYLAGHKHVKRCTWGQTTAALLSLQLGWGLWLFPSDFARLGWIPAVCVTVVLASLTSYSGSLFARLYQAVPEAVLFGDIGQRAAGARGRAIVYGIIYSLDATRCVILHLAATQSLQHALGDAAPPVWLCGLAVAGISAVAVQVRALSELSWFFFLGTSSQLVAIGIVIAELVVQPDKTSATQLVASDVPAERKLVAVMNMIFAYGGQFAFIELMTSMARPQQFPRAITLCTALMTLLYGLLGAAGYWSRGANVAEIVIFSLGDGPAARLAASCILLQALAQYLVNLNCWTHNLLVLFHRRTTKHCALKAGKSADALAANGAANDGANGDVNGDASGNANGAAAAHLDDAAIVVADGDGAAPASEPLLPGDGAAVEPQCSGDHDRLRWAAASVFVISYSFILAITVPYFSALVGIVSGGTYLSCAYAIPCWFALVLLRDQLSRAETLLCRALIPAALLLSAAGLTASVMTLVQEIRTHGSGFSPA